MSYTENKFVVRAKIIDLNPDASYHEAYEYFKPLLGEPDEVDVWDDKVDWFRYEGKYRVVSGDYWGVDYIIAKGDCYEGDMNTVVSLKEINKVVREMIKKFNVKKEDICIAAYSWYNGCDEPIEFA